MFFNLVNTEYVYIYIYTNRCVYIYIYTYIYTHYLTLWGDAYVIRMVEAAPEATRTHTLRGLPAFPPGTHSLACTLTAMTTLTLALRRIPSPLGETMTLTPCPPQTHTPHRRPPTHTHTYTPEASPTFTANLASKLRAAHAYGRKKDTQKDTSLSGDVKGHGARGTS